MCKYASVQVLPFRDGLDPRCAPWRHMPLVAPSWLSFVWNLQKQNIKQGMQVACMHVCMDEFLIPLG